VAFEVLRDFFFDTAFQENQQESELGPDSDLTLADSDPAVHAGSFEMNVVSLPAVIDSEFPGQVARQVVGRFLGFFPGHGMLCTHINLGHRLIPYSPGRISLVAPPASDQYVFALESG